MTKAVPKEEREKIVSAYNNGYKASELANIFNITEWSVYKYLKQYRETGDLTPQKQSGRPPIVTDSVLNILKDIVINNPDGTLEDYREKLEQKTGISVTIVTIHNSCKVLNLRRKKEFFRGRTRE
jgi:transposase